MRPRTATIVALSITSVLGVALFRPATGRMSARCSGRDGGLHPDSLPASVRDPRHEPSTVARPGPNAADLPEPSARTLGLLERERRPGGPTLDAPHANLDATWASLPEWTRRSLVDLESHSAHPRHLLVKVASGAPRQEVLDRIHAEPGSPLGTGASEEMSRWMLAVLPEGAAVDEALLELALAGEAVEYAYPDWIVEALRTPDDAARTCGEATPCGADDTGPQVGGDRGR